MEESGTYCYLRTGEYSHNVKTNCMKTGVVTYDDQFESIHSPSEPLIKV